MQESAIFFNHESGDRLFGYFHQCEQAASIGVVFCHPFGEEKHRSYRAFVKFSRHLAEQGIPSLRFDMRGAGDSDCDLLDSDVETQIDDTQTAISELINKTGVSKVILIGLRFGATIASLTAERDDRITGLLLLSPIIKGKNYWRELLRTKQFASISLNQPSPKTSQLMKELEQNGHLEIEAQRLSRSFVDQLQEVNLIDEKLGFQGDVLITCLSKDSLAQQFSQELVDNYSNASRSCEMWPGEERDYWTILSLYDQYLPQATYDFSQSWMNQKGLSN